MRLFTGIDIPEPIRERLETLMTSLRPLAHFKWSPAYNLHITTKFIGEWDPGRLTELDSALRSIRVSGPVKIEIRGLGWFPNPHSPRVFLAAVHATPELNELASATESKLAGLGLASESRRYSPHLTLARIKEPVPLGPIRGAIAELESVDFGSFTPAHFLLYRSQTGPAGSVYTPLHEYPLHN